MIDILKFRLGYGRQTVAFPDGPAKFPARFRGRPVVDPARCADGCADCAERCPTEAILDPGRASMAVDLGRCLFCGECAEACPSGALRFTNDHRLAARDREALVVRGDEPVLAAALDAEMRRVFGRSLKLRQVSAAGCNGCEAELNAAGNIQFDLGRFGIQFVASPRHADGIVVTGPVSENMRLALQKTYEAVPAPRLVIAVGACAISGGVFRESPVSCGGAAAALPGVRVDLYVPGCPPHPITFLDGMLRMLGRLG
ncbi:4Fe-4S binding protein [Anaeromyxobacter sp. Fw109-5]|uniref:NADH-quinone oxidoreductase subunit B family protein n=1 Tax=Anaeromyxobacter sp. (strain Fw109-5) TaxID=404589 RepID=UPI0000ED70C3|nr:4Fe-4S binding protein [Anaeromyxobacter sp. Fw109-5]ABS27965.1 NADH ubiquinone oxidoreductase 20 kDa subunit [Anaeromyxobacter sp. Fw109-5]